MPESRRHQPSIIRPFRRQRRYRDPFQRPTQRRAAPPAQKTRSCGHYSAAPGAIRSRRGHVPARGSGSVSVIAARSVSCRIAGER